MTDTKLRLFEDLFRELFKPLCGFALKYVKDWDDAKNIVHEAFITVWQKFDAIPPDTNYRSYLYTTVRNRSLNLIRDKKKNVDLAQINEARFSEENKQLETLELSQQIEIGIQSLPAKCREIFQLNRRDGFKYSEIAEKLAISVKTVEAQMSKAMAVLRVHLAEFLSLLFFLLWI